MKFKFNVVEKKESYHLCKYKWHQHFLIILLIEIERNNKIPQYLLFLILKRSMSNSLITKDEATHESINETCESFMKK